MYIYIYISIYYYTLDITDIIWIIYDNFMSTTGLLQFKVIELMLLRSSHDWVIKLQRTHGYPPKQRQFLTMSPRFRYCRRLSIEHQTNDRKPCDCAGTQYISILYPILWKNQRCVQPTLTACLYARNSLKVWLKLVRTWQQRCFPDWRTLYISS